MDNFEWIVAALPGRYQGSPNSHFHSRLRPQTAKSFPNPPINCLTPKKPNSDRTLESRTSRPFHFSSIQISSEFMSEQNNETKKSQCDNLPKHIRANPEIKQDGATSIGPATNSVVIPSPKKSTLHKPNGFGCATARFDYSPSDSSKLEDALHADLRKSLIARTKELARLFAINTECEGRLRCLGNECQKWMEKTLLTNALLNLVLL